MLTKLAFYEQQHFALFGTNNSDFLLFQRERLFSSFVTPDFKKWQNMKVASLKNGTKFTGIFASLVIKLQNLYYWKFKLDQR